MTSQHRGQQSSWQQTRDQKRNGTTTLFAALEAATGRITENPRITRHFTPAGCWWLDMAEIFFAIITRRSNVSGR
jgi:hypothetical protein